MLGIRSGTISQESQSGFTLVELLVTIAVSTILIGSLSVIVNNNTFIAEKGRDQIVTNSFAENKIEELRSKGYLALSDGSTDITSEMPDELKNPRTGTVTISTAGTGLKLTVLTLTYNDQGLSRTHTYKTYIGELGVGQY